MRSYLLTPLLSALLLLTGCAHTPLPKSPRPPQPLAPSLAAEFNDPRPKGFSANETTLRVEPRYTLRRVQLEIPSAEKSPYTNNTVVLDYYQLPHGTNPVIVLLPISGGNYEAETLFARYFAKHGLAVALVHRHEIGQATPAPLAIQGWLIQNLFNHQRVLDWIQTRPELDSQRIGLFGISMGGIQSALLMALDHRIRAGTVGLAAGDLPFILAHSTEKSIARHRNAYMRDHQLTREQFQAELAKAVTCDPALLAPSIDPQKLLLVLGAFDTVVPFEKGWELRHKLGDPETLVLPTGHYTAVLCIPYVQSQCLKFFRQHVSIPGY